MTIKGDIQHSDLPDELLHEPKGASTASNGQVYVANGAGSGSFQNLVMDNITFDKSFISALEDPSYTSNIIVDGTNLSQTTNGVLNDSPAYLNVPQELTNLINKNTKELFSVYANFSTILTELKTETEALSNKINTIISNLKDAGIVPEVEE